MESFIYMLYNIYNMAIITLNMEQENIDFLKSKGINRSELLRQTIAAIKTGDFEYRYL